MISDLRNSQRVPEQPFFVPLSFSANLLCDFKTISETHRQVLSANLILDWKYIQANYENSTAISPAYLILDYKNWPPTFTGNFRKLWWVLLENLISDLRNQRRISLVNFRKTPASLNGPSDLRFKKNSSEILNNRFFVYVFDKSNHQTKQPNAIFWNSPKSSARNLISNFKKIHRRVSLASFIDDWEYYWQVSSAGLFQRRFSPANDWNSPAS